MFLVLSGEGPSDIGVKTDEYGPMSLLSDKWIEPRINYSLIDCLQFTIFSKQELMAKGKGIKPLARRGKKQASETRFYYNNARALARLAVETEQSNTISVLFRDSDGTVSTTSSDWEEKYSSMLSGFKAENYNAGVPMIPKPKSEAWALCALKNNYQNCDGFEGRSGNDKSPISLKSELEQHLGQPGTRILLNNKVDRGHFDIADISMPSMVRFKERLDEVLDSIGVAPRP